MLINDARDLFHKNAVDHGWWENVTIGNLNIPEKLCLIHSEIDEALEQRYDNCDIDGGPVDIGSGDGYYRVEDGKPEGVLVELADVVIRVLDLCGFLEIDCEFGPMDENRFFRFSKYATIWAREQPITPCTAWIEVADIDNMLAHLHVLTTEALERHRKHDDPGFHRALILLLVYSMAGGHILSGEMSPDFTEVIMLKHEYNKSRPYRHGGLKS